MGHLFLFIIFIVSAVWASELKLVEGGAYKPLLMQGKSTKVKNFKIDEAPVTNLEFEIFVKSNPRWQRGTVKSLFADGKYLAHWKLDSTVGDKELENSPVVNVSWFAARAYCDWRQMRLPTVDEWEFLAQYGPIEAGSDVKGIILEWYSKPTPEKLPAIKSTFKNKFGIWDIHGLVWEWTYDFNTTLVTGESRGDTALEKSMFCGSGAVGAADPANYAAFMRFGFRSSLKGNYSVGNLGFRCAKGLEK